jgi:hypothetical protein
MIWEAMHTRGRGVAGSIKAARRTAADQIVEAINTSKRAIIHSCLDILRN